MINFNPSSGPLKPVNTVCTVTRMLSTTRTSWMANNLNAIPDSIIMNKIFRSLLLPVELNEPNVRSTEVGVNSRNALRILNTIKAVIRAFTAMDMAKPVRVNVFPQGALIKMPCSNVSAPSAASQVAIDDKLSLRLD
jgi:hypothetical protein